MKLPVIPVASGIIIKDNKILIGLRSKKDQGGGLWEFPGGKIELEESELSAVIRELKEELGINVSVQQKVMQYIHRFKNTLYDISFFEINSFEGEVKMNVHDDIRWVDLGSLKDYLFISGDLLFIDKLIDDPYILNSFKK
jgi:mutator protein MutT